MKRLRVLVNSPGLEIRDLLAGVLARERFDVVSTQPGPAFVTAARRECPEVAVLDRVHERPDTAEMEIEILKAIRPEVRIIVLSGVPSARDAGLVERGIFYYMASPVGSELVKIVEAAATYIMESAKKSPPHDQEGGFFMGLE